MSSQLVFPGVEFPKKNGRIANDFYPTPTALTESLLKIWKPDVDDVCFEPCAAYGAIADAFKSRGYPTKTSDLIEYHGLDYMGDATTDSPWLQCKNIDWTVTNPPFHCFNQILEKAWQYSQKGVVMLLGINTIEPTKERRELLLNLSNHQRFLIPVNPRPRFRKDKKGTAGMTVAWFVWDKRFSWDSLDLMSPFQYMIDWQNISNA